MQLKLDLKIFIFIILFCLTGQIEIYFLLLLFALLHELGHLIAGLCLKLKPKRMELNPFGLSITFEGYGEKFKDNIPIKRILIALAGPMVNLLFILIALFLPINVNRELILYSNLILLLLNLLPIYPLDGGRILKNILHKNLGFWESVQITNKISNLITICLTIVASITIFYFQNIAILLIALYLCVLVIQENRRYQLLKKVHDIIIKENLGLEKV